MSISTASILIRFSDAPSFVIAFYRVFLTTLLLFAVNPVRIVRIIKRIERRMLFVSVWAGLFLALHFGAWITSLEYTTVANAVILVDSGPLFALVLSRYFLKEGASAASLIGLLVTVAGAVVIGWGDVSADPRYFTGDVLAIIGAVSIAAYLVCGRIVRGSLELTPFLVLVYGFSSLFLGILCIIFDTPFSGYSVKNYMLFAGLAVIPTIGGHSLFLYTLRYMKAYLVNLCFLGEPIGAAILAFLFFSEIPAWHFYAGGILIIGGSLFAIFREGTRSIE